jgi:hypothetical protein
MKQAQSAFEQNETIAALMQELNEKRERLITILAQEEGDEWKPSPDKRHRPARGAAQGKPALRRARRAQPRFSVLTASTTNQRLHRRRNSASAAVRETAAAATAASTDERRTDACFDDADDAQY